MSLNIALGYVGMINLAHIAFYGIGAYTSAILTVRYDQPFVVAFVVAGILASICGWLVTVITNKLKGDYFALGTLGFAFVMYAIFLNWSSITRGPLGIPGIPKPEIFGKIIFQPSSYLIFAAIVLGITWFILWRLGRSRYGTLLQAVRDDSIGAQSLGKNIFRLKAEAMMFSAFFAGIAGSLYAHYISFIDPSTFYLNDIIIILTMVIVGGLVSLRGSFLAAVIIILLPEMLRFVSLPSSMIGPMRQIMYALLLIVILMYRPRGLFGKVDLE